MNYLISRAPMAFLAAITLATITLHIPPNSVKLLYNQRNRINTYKRQLYGRLFKPPLIPPLSDSEKTRIILK